MQRHIQTENFIIDTELRNIRKAPGGEPALFYGKARRIGHFKEIVMYGQKDSYIKRSKHSAM